MNRIKLIFLLLAWLTGDSVVAATVAPPAKPKLESTAAAHTPKPLVIPAAKAAAKTSSKAQSVAKPAGKTQASKTKKTPAKKAQVRKAPPAKKSSATNVRQATKAKSSAASVKKAKLPSAKLNLSLPPELLEKMHFNQPVVESNEAPLLPPLFVEDKPEPSRYQLSGKLITNERQRAEQDNYLDGFDGAELSIEYRQ